MDKIKIKSYGKVNLSLDVTGKRDDGYHEIQTIMQKISLFDVVTVTWTGRDGKDIEISLTCDKPYLPTDRRNLAYAGAQIMARQFAGKVGGGLIDIKIEKHIPVAAGLAGGSGNGAAVMTALSRIWDTGLGAKELCAMGEELGADVPFCILTQNTGYGLALCTGTGASLTPLRSRFKRAVLLVKPHFGVSTREVYQNIDSCSIEKRPDTDMLVKALRNNSHRHIYSNMINVLEEYTLKHYPEVEKIKEMIEKETSAEKVLMTGSGPTVFAVFSHVRSAQEACLYMRKRGYSAYWATTL